MICRKCGKENSDFSQKCYFCGDNLSTQSTLNNQNVYSNTMQSSVNTINSNNNLNVFGVPGIQNNSNVNSIHPIVEKEEIKFDSPVVESSPVIHQNTYNLGQSFNSVNTINSTNNINNVGTIQANPQMQQGSLINNVNPQGINNNIVTSDNNVIKNEPIINQQTNLQTNNDAFEKNNNIQSNVQVLEQKAVPSVSNKKTNNKKISNTLFIVAALLVVVALILIAIPILSKKTNRLEDINNNSKLNVNDNGEITGKLKIVHLNSNIEYDVKSNYYNNNGVYNIKLDLSLNNQLINSYIEVSSKSLNIYIPSEFIDLFGKTKSEETQWIKYSIDFINEIDIDNYKLAELFDENHFKYVNDVNDTKHYRLLLDNSIFASNNSIEYLDNLNLELYTNSNNYITRFATLISNIGDDNSSIDIDVKFGEDNSTSITIPQQALNTNLTLEEYIDNNKLEV